MSLARLAAILAPLFTCIQLLPQLYKTYSTKSVKDLSLESLMIITVGNFLWLLHGYFIRDTPLLVAGLVASLVNGGLLWLYMLYSL
jgi:MtN3 and saliva related transmembrane protein